MGITQRQIGLALLGLLTVGALLFGVVNLAQGQFSLGLMGLVTAAVEVALLFAYWRGWEPARYAIILLTTAGMIAVASDEKFALERFPTAAFVSPVIALILTSPRWVALSGIGVIGVMLSTAAVRFPGRTSVYQDPSELLIYATVIGGMILSRLVTERAQRNAEQSAARAEEALARAEAQAQELSTLNTRANTQLDEQRRLLDLVATLETPAVQLAEGVLFAPLVGHLDSRRAEAFTSRLLAAAHEQRARLIVLDIAGVAMVDTTVARALLGATQALRLLGCDVTISGISAGVAITLTQLGLNLEGVTTVRSPQEALARAMTGGLGERKSEAGTAKAGAAAAKTGPHITSSLVSPN
jgi:rsbT co-antagonist protein RsbR